MIYSKTLRISNSTNKEFTQGEIVNFLQVDADKVITLCWVFPQVAKLPIALVFAWGLLLYFFGLSLLGAVGIGSIVMGINYLLALWNSKIQQRVLDKKDTRMKYTTESINNIKTVKLNSMIDYYLSKIMDSRKDEVYQTKLKYISGAIELFS